jgi:hypothetical protein
MGIVNLFAHATMVNAPKLGAQIITPRRRYQ